MIVRASEELRLSASAAVAPSVVTPKSNEARSGVASTVPLPVTVIVEPEEDVAERPRRGCATPAIAAATSSTPASTRMVRSLFMPRIRHRGADGHTALISKPCHSAKQTSVEQTQLLKGVLELAVLAVIARG